MPSQFPLKQRKALLKIFGAALTHTRALFLSATLLLQLALSFQSKRSFVARVKRAYSPLLTAHMFRVNSRCILIRSARIFMVAIYISGYVRRRVLAFFMRARKFSTW